MPKRKRRPPPDEFTRRLSRVLSAELKRQDLSSYALSKLCAVSEDTIRRAVIGTHEPGLSALVKMLAALGRSLTWLERELKAP